MGWTWKGRGTVLDGVSWKGLFAYFIYLFILYCGHTHSMQKFPVQRLNLCPSCNLCHRCSSAGALTHCTTGELPGKTSVKNQHQQFQRNSKHMSLLPLILGSQFLPVFISQRYYPIFHLQQLLVLYYSILSTSLLRDVLGNSFKHQFCLR